MTMKQKAIRLNLRTRKQLKYLAVALYICLGLGLLGLLAILGINGIVTGSTKDRIISVDAAAQLEDVDCILVLGCGLTANGQPSAMLHDRLTQGVALYQRGAAPKLLMTGDHGRVNYDEVDAMKRFAVDAGIPAGDVFMDHAGFSTYESIYRAKEIFQARKIVIVTQEYHLHRALYIAQQFGLEAYGVSADLRSYYGQTARDLREVLARVKDFGTSILKPEPTYLGETIPIWGDGNLTNDENSSY